MVIVYREPSEYEMQIILDAILEWVEKDILHKITNKYHFIIGEGNWKEIFITNTSTANTIRNLNKITPYSIGLGIGEIRNDEFLFSLSGGGFIFDYSNKKAIINIDAEQLFLYKRDIHCKSITSIKEGLLQGDKVLIANSNNDYLGLGKIVLPISEIKNPQNEDEVAIKNIIDLGWYLRKGK